jgi:hypothetical protein
MLDAIVQYLPTDLLRVISVFHAELCLQEHLQVCRRLFLQFRDLEGQFQEESARYNRQLQYHFRTLWALDSHWHVRDEITSLKEIFRKIGGHRDRAYRQLLAQYKQYGRALNYYVNDLAYEICEQLWLSLYVLNRTPDGRRTLQWNEVTKARAIFTTEVRLIQLGLQALPRYEKVKLQLLQYILRRIHRYLNSWTFCFRRWVCDPPVTWVELHRLLQEDPDALQRFLTLVVVKD